MAALSWIREKLKVNCKNTYSTFTTDFHSYIFMISEKLLLFFDLFLHLITRTDRGQKRCHSFSLMTIFSPWSCPQNHNYSNKLAKKFYKINFLSQLSFFPSSSLCCIVEAVTKERQITHYYLIFAKLLSKSESLSKYRRTFLSSYISLSITLRACVNDQYFSFWHITHHQHAVFCIYDDVIIMAILILAVASAIRLSWQRKSAKTEPANAIGYTWYLSNIIYFIFVTSPSKIKQWISLVVSLNIHQEFVQGFCKIVWIKIYLCDRKYIK